MENDNYEKKHKITWMKKANQKKKLDEILVFNAENPATISCFFTLRSYVE